MASEAPNPVPPNAAVRPERSSNRQAGGAVQTGADVVLVCPHLGDGGTQRVVSIVANAWSQLGRRVCVVTLYDQPDFYRLTSGVIRVSLGTDSLPLLLRPLGLAARAARDLVERLFPGCASRIAATLSAPAARIVRAVARGFSRLGLERALDWALRLHPPTLFRMRGLRRAVRRLRPSVVAGFSGSTNLITVIACRGTGCRVLISERNDPELQTLSFPWNDLRPRIYAEADLVTANAHGSLAALRAWVAPRKLRFLPNPLTILRSGWSDVPPPGFTRPCALIVGRLCEQKAHDVLFAAMALLPTELSHWRLAVVGRGEAETALRGLAEELGVADRIQWHGQVESTYAFYRFSDLFVLPSRHEGMPNALLEAMSCGLPPIVSDASPGPLEVVRHGVTGLVVPVGDPRALADAIALLAARPDLRRRLGDAARREVSGYQFDTALAAWDEVFGWSSSLAEDRFATPP